MVVKSYLTPAVSTNDWLSRRLVGLKGSGVDACCAVVGCISGIVFGSVLVIMTASPFVYATRAPSLGECRRELVIGISGLILRVGPTAVFPDFQRKLLDALGEGDCAVSGGSRCRRRLQARG